MLCALGVVVAVAVVVAGCSDGAGGGGDNSLDGGGVDGSGVDSSGVDSDAGDDSDAGGAAGSMGVPATALVAAGVWRSNFGATERIGAGRWVSSSPGLDPMVMHLVGWSDDSRVVIAQADKADPYNPSKYVRIIAEVVGAHEVAYCMVDFGLATAAAAVASVKKADATDLDGKGCGGFAWTRLTRPAPAGLWESAFGGNERFDAAHFAWAETTSWNNATRTAISRNSDDDPYNPGAYNVSQWTAGDGATMHYCNVAFGIASAELAAASTATADDSDLDGKGCGGFGWTNVAAHEVKGAWSSSFGGFEHIDGLGWGPFNLVSFTNAERVAIVQSHLDDPYTPGQFARIRWTAPSGGSFHYCIEVFGKDSAKAALEAGEKADASDVDGKGCGGFPWTKLTAPGA